MWQGLRVCISTSSARGITNIYCMGEQLNNNLWLYRDLMLDCIVGLNLMK